MLDISKMVHRPWPIPSAPPIMSQVWHDLLFMHWPIPVDQLQMIVPKELPIDTFEGRAWIAVVPFTMSDIRLRGLPAVPWLSQFPELNVRTYVTVDGKSGVYFFSLDAGNPLAVLIARMWFHLPYYWAKMKATLSEGKISYSSQRRFTAAADYAASYEPVGDMFQAEKGSLPYWLIERYCLYTVGRNGQVSRGEIHHEPWKLQNANATIDQSYMTSILGLTLPSDAPLLHFSKRQEVVVWPPSAV